MKHIIHTPEGHRVTVILNSWIPRVLMPGAINAAVTLTGHTVRFSRGWYTRFHLAHECGHILQARRRGWYYLPWVLGSYLRSGYRNSAAELGADLYAHRSFTRYEHFGRIPEWVLRR